MAWWVVKRFCFNVFILFFVLKCFPHPYVPFLSVCVCVCVGGGGGGGGVNKKKRERETKNDNT